MQDPSFIPIESQVPSSSPFSGPAPWAPQKVGAQVPLTQVVSRSGQSGFVRQGFSQIEPPVSGTHFSWHTQSASVLHGLRAVPGPATQLPVEPPDVEPTPVPVPGDPVPLPVAP